MCTGPADRTIRMVALYRTILAIKWSFVITAAIAQSPGDVDLNFATSGIGFGGGYVRRVLPLSDGRVLVSGTFTTYDSIPVGHLVRLTAEGFLDTTFQIGTGPDDDPFMLLEQPDGRYLIGGTFHWVNGIERNGLVRLNMDGSVDPTLDPGSGFGPNDGAEYLALQDDGRILIAGGFDTYQGVSRKDMVRVLADGSLDTTFDPGTGSDLQTQCVLVRPNGKVVYAGWFSSVNGHQVNSVVQLNADGSVDTTFSVGSGPYGLPRTVEDMVLQPDGKIILGGWFYSFNGSQHRGVVRIDTTGATDVTFDDLPGPGTVWSLVLQGDGRVVVGGSFDPALGYFNNIVRLQSDGTLDTGFDPGSGAMNEDGGADMVLSVAQSNDGGIFIGGMFELVDSIPRHGIAKFVGDIAQWTTPPTDPGMFTVGPWMPNPSFGHTTLQYSLASREAVVIEVHDPRGALVERHQLGVRMPGEHRFDLMVDTWPPGVYLCSVTVGKERVTRELLVVQ
jgi:uncharacterized delta-60 repeat protein